MQTQTQESRGLHRISQNQKPHVQYDSNICIFSYRKIIYQMQLSLHSEKTDDFFYVFLSFPNLLQCTNTTYYEGKLSVLCFQVYIHYTMFRDILPSQQLLLFWKFLLPYLQTIMSKSQCQGSTLQFSGLSTSFQFSLS